MVTLLLQGIQMKTEVLRSGDKIRLVDAYLTQKDVSHSEPKLQYFLKKSKFVFSKSIQIRKNVLVLVLVLLAKVSRKM